jgi:quinol monooxygenase YgiN
VYGRIATVSIKPQMERQFLDGLRHEGVPTLMVLGCMRLDVYLDSAGSQAQVITLWPTQHAAEAVTRATLWQALRARLEETLAGEPIVQIMSQALAY